MKKSLSQVLAENSVVRLYLMVVLMRFIVLLECLL